MKIKTALLYPALLIVLLGCVFAYLPRYEIVLADRVGPGILFIRADRWTGNVEISSTSKPRWSLPERATRGELLAVRSSLRLCEQPVGA